ncbi:MAG: DUF3078 domain-containing protein [Saprospiraceae bacterium]
MKNISFLIALALSSNLLFSQADNATAQEAERKKLMDASMNLENKEGWVRKGGVGLDLGQLININPYVGAGSNRLGIGGAVMFKANLKRNLLSWNNEIGINLSTQRIGSGTLSLGSDEKVPFEKALDIFNLSSNIAYKIGSNSPWAYSADLFFVSQFLNSNVDSATNKIYLKELHTGIYNTTLVSKFLSPANFTFALGLKYQKQKNWYFFLSPIALKAIVISDQEIANLGVHGTKLKANSLTEYNKSLLGLGALVRAGYTQKVFNKINIGSEVLLFSDYLDNPQNIDLNWLNNLAVEIFKGFNLNLKLDLYYDDNKTNNISDNNAIGGILGQGKRINLIQQLLLSYNRSF